MRSTRSALALSVISTLASCTYSVQAYSLQRATNPDALFIEEGVCAVTTSPMLASYGPVALTDKAALYVLSDVAGLDLAAPYIDRLISVLKEEMARTGYVELAHRDFGMVQLLGHPDASQVELLINRNGQSMSPEVIALDLSAAP